MKFKGFEGWMEVFRTGTHTDSAGNVREWREDDLQKIAESYAPDNNEAPVVIGHPSDDSPAYGWVEKLKTEGGILWAKCRNIVPEFADMVKQGLFKKRSIALYPDLALRHIGFLGATPPAVKGLADIKFSKDKEAIIFEFIQKHKTAKREEAMTFKEFTEMFKFWKEAEGNPDMQIPVVVNQKPADKTFSEADIDTAKKEAAKAERKKTETEFAEKALTAKREARTEEIKGYCEAKLKEGKIIPAWTKSGLVEFMQNLDAETEIEFSEKSKSTGLDWFKNFLEELPKLVEFKEIASRDKDVAAGDAAGKIEAFITKKREADKGLSYGDAFSAVQIEHPELATEYQQEMTG